MVSKPVSLIVVILFWPWHLALNKILWINSEILLVAIWKSIVVPVSLTKQLCYFGHGTLLLQGYQGCKGTRKSSFSKENHSLSTNYFLQFNLEDGLIKRSWHYNLFTNRKPKILAYFLIDPKYFSNPIARAKIIYLNCQ